MIIFAGVAGSGKSLQGKLLADRLGLPWLSTGEFLRMLITGKRRQDMLDGKLLSDRETIELVQKIFTLIDTKKEFVLDGFPRTEAQADWLLSQVKHGQLAITGIIHLQASQTAVKKRLLSRGRQDDTEKAITARFQEYEHAIKPILEDFNKVGIPVHEINGQQSIEAVHNDIKRALAQKS